MVVAAHGNVDKYCAEHGMVIGERYTGKVEDYRGSHLVLVTDNCSDMYDYFYLKYLLLKRRVSLISTHWESHDIEEFLAYLNDRERRGRYGGRLPFGFRREGGENVLTEEGRKVVGRILELKDSGATYREIVEDDGVRHPDGRRISISTIQVILRNRSKYEG